MNYEEAHATLVAIEASSLADLRRDLIITAVRYAEIRAKWALETPDERLLMDGGRTRAHNTLIDACNILSRNQAKAGEDNSWRRRLGDDRKVIGDFACFLHCILGIRAR